MKNSFKKTFVFFAAIIFILSFTYPKTVNAEKNLSGFKPNDIRPKILKDYLDKHSSPLAENAKDFVESADTFDLDWRLVVSIAGVESTFGKFIPTNSYNAWGWGVYGNNVIYFSSWKEGIETVSKGLRENYINKMETANVYHIGRWYAASPTWASRVEYFMNKIAELQSDKAIYNLSISL